MFDKTKASSADNTEEDAKKDLNEEEDTSTDNDQSDNNEEDQEEDTSTNESDDSDEDESDDGSEETVTLSKTEHEKLIQDRDNYKRGLLAEKAKKRGIDSDSSTDSKVDVSEEKIEKVLNKKNEKEALRNVIDPKHADYIPELVDDAQYTEIISYLPRNIDRSSTGGIVRALRLATKMWKEDKGIKETETKKKPGSALAATKKATANSKAPEKGKVSGERKILKGSQGMDSWYKKD